MRYVILRLGKSLRAEGLRSVLSSQWLRGHAALDAAVLSKHVVPGSINVYWFGWVSRRSSRGVSQCKTVKKGVIDML